ncbi:Uroporphyrinogen-III synthase [Aspergillus sclerotialis]|uniref:Uroporphyrinogen-III synthase n=1 Tax=Aspergillus sclerotialis TaxID=2070753 RepID=A0A3A2Z3Y6_9EURO|nr:Uroporphyrinogen-III synthase [Aspergillus sclerotialis]
MTSQTTSPTILLLKTKSSLEDKYATLFSSKNFNSQFIPVLEHHFHSDALVSVRDLFTSGGLLPGPGRRYGGLIFTSQRAVEGFASILGEVDEKTLHTSSTNLPIYTVGPATSSSLSHLKETKLPHAEILDGDCGNGERLAGFILKHYNTLPHSITHPNETDAPSGSESQETETKEEEGGKLPLLFLTGEQHRDVIPKTLMSESLPEEERIGVEEKIVYGTGVVEGFEGVFKERVSCLLDQDKDGDGDGDGELGTRGGGVVWITVFSPAGCASMLSVLKQLHLWDGDLSSSDTSPGTESRPGTGTAATATGGKKRVYVATIGKTTRDHLRKYGFEADVCAEKPSPEGLWGGISRVMDDGV